MYKRLKSSIVEPKQLANYAHDRFGKVILYILILSILLMLPKVFNLRYIPSDIKCMVRDTIVIKDEVEYVIKDNKLQSTTSENVNYTYFLDIENNMVGYNFYVAIGESINFKKIKYPTNSMIIHYALDGVYFVIPLSATEDGYDFSYKLCDYEGYEIDLRNIHVKDSNERNEFFNILKHYIDDKMPIIYGIGLPILLISSAIEIVMISLMMSFICFLVNRKFRLKFKIAFRLVVYSMFSYVFGYVLSELFGTSIITVFLYYGGFFVTITYYMIAVKQYLINEYLINRNED